MWAYRANSSTSHPVAVVGGATVVATTAAGIQAFTATSGALLWTYANIVKEHNVLQNGTTLFVVVHGFSGVVVALDLLTGREQWRTSVTPDVNVIRLSPDASLPILFLHTQDENYNPSGVIALHAVTGDVLWNNTVALFALPAVVRGVCALSNDVYVVGVNCITGVTIWSTQRTIAGSGATSIYAATSLDVFLVTFDEWSSLELVALNASTGALLWNHTHEYGPGPVVLSPDEQTFLTITTHFSGIRNFLVCYSVVTGEMLWTATAWTDGYDAVRILATTSLYFIGGYDDYTFALFQRNGTTAWNTTYAISSADVSLNADMSVMYAGIDASIGAVNISTGKVLWAHGVQLALKYAPLPVGDMVVGGSQDTYLYGVRGGVRGA